ncbi:MAG: TraM recognition domain-containing protein [Pseudomonadota bacterium]
MELSQADRRRHLYAIGQTGSGKTTFLKFCILQDVYAGRGFALIDPHGDLASEIVDALPRNRVRDCVYLNPSDRACPIGFNPLVGVETELQAVVAANLLATFRSIWRENWGPRLEHILANALAALLAYGESHPVSLLALPSLLTNDRFRRHVLKSVDDPIVRDFWLSEFGSWDYRFRQEAIAPVLNKAGAFMRAPVMRNILGQDKSSFDLGMMMDQDKILIVNLSKGILGEDMTNLLGSLLVCSIYQQAMSRSDQAEDERRDFHLYIDEFQNFTTDAFDAIVSEARKYRLSLCIAHQYLDQLPIGIKRAILGNVGTMMLFALSGKDAEELSVELHPFTASYLRQTGRGQAIALSLENGERIAPELLSVPFGSTSRNSRERVVRNCRTRFGKDRATVEAKLYQWFQKIG